MDQKTVKEIGIPNGGFSIIFDSCGEITDVINEKGESVKSKGLPLKAEKIEKVVGDLTLMYVHSSPGHWIIVNRRRYWCP
jgi:hypothetical protein